MTFHHFALGDYLMKKSFSIIIVHSSASLHVYASQYQHLTPYDNAFLNNNAIPIN
jgi:hypothetical protein